MRKVSVIIPVYNTEQYLRRCIESVLAQTFSDFELILVDDGSTDASGSICEEFAARDGRVAVIHQENAGQAAARNAALSAAETEYIVFADADDYVDRNYLSGLIDCIGIDSADLVMSGFLLEDESGGVLMTHQRENARIDLKNGKVRTDFILNRIVNDLNSRSCWAALFRADIIRNHSVRFCTTCNNFAEDTAFLMTYLLYCEKIAMTDHTDYHYIRRSGSSLTGMAKDNVAKLNSLNEVSFSFAQSYFALFNGRYYKKKFSQLYFHLMKWDYNQYNLFEVEPEQTVDHIKKINRLSWHDTWLKRGHYHLNDLIGLYGKRRALRKWANIRLAVRRSPGAYRFTLFLIDQCLG